MPEDFISPPMARPPVRTATKTLLNRGSIQTLLMSTRNFQIFLAWTDVSRAMAISWTIWIKAHTAMKESKTQKDMCTVSSVITPIINQDLGKVGLSNVGPVTNSDQIYPLCLLKMRPV